MVSRSTLQANIFWVLIAYSRKSSCVDFLFTNFELREALVVIEFTLTVQILAISKLQITVSMVFLSLKINTP